MNALARLDSATAVPLATTRLAVPGVRCAGCIAKLESGLPSEPGIIGARVNLTAKQIAVTHDAALSPPDLIAAIARHGQDATILSGDTASAAARRDPDGLLRALAVAGFAAMNVMLLSVSVWSGADGSLRQLFHWLSALIALPAITYAGHPFFTSAWRALRVGRTNMDVPISIGVTLTTAMSLYETITGGDHAWFDAALMLLAFLLIGRVLDELMRGRAADAAAALAQQLPGGALLLLADGTTRWTATALLQAGDRILVAAGERLAADGEVAHGQSSVDNGLITGEAAPVPVGPGSAVIAGTLNLIGPIEVVVAAVGDDSVIATMSRLMASAGEGRSRYIRIADRASRYYAPAVHGLAALAFAGWMIAGAGWHQSLLISVAVLLITCPCALGLAVPVAQTVARGSLMRAGVLVKDGSAFERLAEADNVIFDKTGTLTLGRPTPCGLDSLDADQRSVMLALAATSRHPLSQALRRALEADGVRAAALNDIAEAAGSGVTGQWQGRMVALGRPGDGSSGVALTLPDHPTALVRFDDGLRPQARDAVDALAALGLPGIIATGDRGASVVAVADATGLTAMAGLSPEDKYALLDRRGEAGQRVLMVGDGLNDGPALARAHVSMAPSGASDVSQQAADIVFLGDSLAVVPMAVRAARRTMAIVRQNFALAIGYNVIAVPLAIGGYVTPLVAAIAMSLSSILVVANALRLRGCAA